MSNQKSVPPPDFAWVRWKDIVRSLYMTGMIPEITKATCFQVNAMLKKGMDAGRVQHKKEGGKSYWAIDQSMIRTTPAGKRYVSGG